MFRSHGFWLAFFEGYIASGAGNTDRAMELATTAAAVGRQLGVPDLEMLGLALEGAGPHLQLDRVPALELLVCARVARGELDEARQTVESLRDIAGLVRTAPLHASADLAEGLLMAACGEHESARTLLEDAVDRFERSGGVYNAARARLELATSLAARSRRA